MHRNNRSVFCNKWVWGTPGGGEQDTKYTKIIGFSLSVLVQLEKRRCNNEKFNSNNNKNGLRNVVHRNNMVAFCNKWVWGTPGGNKIQTTLKL